jgi:hypothetical protein
MYHVHLAHRVRMVTVVDTQPQQYYLRHGCRYTQVMSLSGVLS